MSPTGLPQVGAEAVFVTKAFDKGVNDYISGLKKSEKATQDSADVVKRAASAYNTDYVQGLNRGIAGNKEFSAQLIASADKMGLSTSQINRMAGATGMYSDQERLAAQSTANMAK